MSLGDLISSETITVAGAVGGAFVGSIVGPLLVTNRQARLEREHFLREQALPVYTRVMAFALYWRRAALHSDGIDFEQVQDPAAEHATDVALLASEDVQRAYEDLSRRLVAFVASQRRAARAPGHMIAVASDGAHVVTRASHLAYVLQTELRPRQRGPMHKLQRLRRKLRRTARRWRGRF